MIIGPIVEHGSRKSLCLLFPINPTPITHYNLANIIVVQYIKLKLFGKKVARIFIHTFAFYSLIHTDREKDSSFAGGMR